MKKRNKKTRMLVLALYLLLAGAAAASAQRMAKGEPVGIENLGGSKGFAMPVGALLPAVGHARGFAMPQGTEIPHPITGMPIGSEMRARTFAMPQGSEYFGVPR